MAEQRLIHGYGKHQALVVRESEPLNAEPPPHLLRESFVTPESLFFVRNHGSVPEVEPASFRLAVSGMVSRRLDLSLHEIRTRFRPKTIVSTLQCAGNRRDGLAAVALVEGEVSCEPCAPSNSVWTEVSLCDVLKVAGIGVTVLARKGPVRS